MTSLLTWGPVGEQHESAREASLLLGSLASSAGGLLAAESYNTYKCVSFSHPKAGGGEPENCFYLYYQERNSSMSSLGIFLLFHIKESNRGGVEEDNGMFLPRFPDISVTKETVQGRLGFLGILYSFCF